MQRKCLLLTQSGHGGAPLLQQNSLTPSCYYVDIAVIYYVRQNLSVGGRHSVRIRHQLKGLQKPWPNRAAGSAIKMITASTITCPKCGYHASEQMPTDACQFFYVCGGCGERLKPEARDCCVFCSYGTMACPPTQLNRSHSAPFPTPTSSTRPLPPLIISTAWRRPAVDTAPNV